MKGFLHFLRALRAVFFTVIALIGVYFAYLALPPPDRQTFWSTATAPIPLWVVAILVFVLVAAFVAWVTARIDRGGQASLGFPARAAGLASEIAAGLSNGNSKVIWADQTAESTDKIAYMIELLEQLTGHPHSRSDKHAVEAWKTELRKLPDITLALLNMLVRWKHLDGTEIAALRRTTLWPSLQALRRTGLLVPVVAAINKEVVYWLPPGEHKAIKEAMLHLKPPSSANLQIATDALLNAGYKLPESLLPLGVNGRTSR